MKTDSQLQVDVMEELKWEPSLDHEKVGVAVTAGVVTLSGIVNSYAEKLLAEQASRRVKGVRALAEDLIVRYPGEKKTTDPEIARRVSDVLQWDPLVPRDRIEITVEDGVVRLSGDVDWHYEKDLAFKDASKISGVICVENLIRVKPSANIADVKERIERAFERQADLEAENIQVRADDRKIVLSGRVSSCGKRALAERAAWAAPGVNVVEDNLIVS